MCRSTIYLQSTPGHRISHRDCNFNNSFNRASGANLRPFTIPIAAKLPAMSGVALHLNRRLLHLIPGLIVGLKLCKQTLSVP